MHYKNGREAKNGDKIVYLSPYSGCGSAHFTGILYGANAEAGSDCNGRIAQTRNDDPTADLKNCLHVDDIAAATIPDTTLPAPVNIPLPSPPDTTVAPTGTLGTAAALIVALLLLAVSAKAQTNSTASDFYNGILNATNYSLNVYGTYAPKAPDKVGGGLLVVYNVNKYAGLAIGGDYLGQFSLVSGNATLQLPINVGNYITAPWATNITVTPFVLAGIGKPTGGSSGSGVATIEDIGSFVRFGHLWGGYFDAGVSVGQWQGAGKYSGTRYHGFLGWTHGF